MEKKKVIYLGEVWDSDIWMNETTFRNFKNLHPENRVLVSSGGSTLSVEIKSVDLCIEHRHRK